MSNLDLPFIASIPYYIQDDETLPDSIKLYFGQIVGLSVKCGYIWASDDQLSIMKRTSIKNIERWNKILEEKGYITRETKNYPKEQTDGKWGWEKKRKIYINEGFQRQKPISKKVYEPLKNEGSLEPLKNEGSLEPLKNEGIYSNLLDKSSKQQPEAPTAIVVSSELEKLELDVKLKIMIMQKHSDEEIKIAVDRCLKWKSRPSDSIGIMTAFKKADSWSDTQSSETIQENNNKYLSSLQDLDGKKIALNNIVIGKNYIEFTCGPKCTVFQTNDVNFKKLVTEHLEILYKWENENEL